MDKASTGIYNLDEVHPRCVGVTSGALK